jgi:hypothetical protein
MNQFLVLEHCNLFCGTETAGPDVSNHLILNELQLPRFAEQYIGHSPGGAPVAVEIDVILQHLEASFVLAGIQPQVMRLLRPYNAQQTWFVALGFVRDPQSGDYTQAMAQMQGRLGEIEPANWKRGATFQTKYAIHSIMQYRLEVAGYGNIITWDFYNNFIDVG